MRCFPDPANNAVNRKDDHTAYAGGSVLFIKFVAIFHPEPQSKHGDVKCQQSKNESHTQISEFKPRLLSTAKD
jgi:hypothetical protein